MEDTPQPIESISEEALKSALKSRSSLEHDIKVLSIQIDTSLATIQAELNNLAQLRSMINQRIDAND